MVHCLWVPLDFPERRTPRDLPHRQMKVETGDFRTQGRWGEAKARAEADTENERPYNSALNCSEWGFHPAESSLMTTACTTVALEANGSGNVGL